MEQLVSEYGIPEFWRREPGFRTLVLFILEQQVSLASAQAAFVRLEEGMGGIDPEQLRQTPDAIFRQFGVSRQKSRYIRELSSAVLSGDLDLDTLPGSSDDKVRSDLTQVPGIGQWTAQVYLLSALGRPDIWPVGDRALQVATQEALALEHPPDQEELEQVGERWRPLRAVAARLLWHGYLGRRQRSNGPI